MILPALPVKADLVRLAFHPSLAGSRKQPHSPSLRGLPSLVGSQPARPSALRSPQAAAAGVGGKRRQDARKRGRHRVNGGHDPIGHEFNGDGGSRPALTPTQQVFAALSLWDAVKADED